MRSAHPILALLLAACFSKPDRVEAIDATPPIDAATCVAARCSTAGGTCEGDTCVIVETTDMAVTCPNGMPCRIDCLVANACKKGVDCGNATTCEVQCIGDSACKDKGIDCGTATTCTVSCIGMNACQHAPVLPGTAVMCNNSDCVVTCDGTGACEDGIDVGVAGTCDAHCCNGGCPAPVVDPQCTRDMVCP